MNKVYKPEGYGVNYKDLNDEDLAARIADTLSDIDKYSVDPHWSSIGAEMALFSMEEEQRKRQKEKEQNGLVLPPTT